MSVTVTEIVSVNVVGRRMKMFSVDGVIETKTQEPESLLKGVS